MRALNELKVILSAIEYKLVWNDNLTIRELGDLKATRSKIISEIEEIESTHEEIDGCLLEVTSDL